MANPLHSTADLTSLRTLILVAAAGLAAAAVVMWRDHAAPGTAAPDQAAIAFGQRVYDQNCASCHGAALQGQPDWKIPNENGRYRAPPHDETGHTWHHADALLERIIRQGSAAVVGNGYESDMPGFAGILSEDEIAAVLSYIKSTWPEKERAFQRRITQGETP